MKTRTFLLAGALLTLLASCNQEEALKGTSMKEGVLQARIEGPLTKTSFDNVEGKLSWTEGDKIAVHFNTGEFGEFEVSPADGTVEVLSGSAHYRDFYAVYPSADAVEGTTLQVNLPDSYDVTDIVNGTLTPDYAPVPMVALNDESSSFLDFYHVGGLMRLILKDVPAGSKTVKVITDKDITGTYTVSNAESLGATLPEPTITTSGSSSNNEVTFVVSEQGLASEMAELVLNLPIPCGSYESIIVEAWGDDSSIPLFECTFDKKVLVFERHHGKKLNIQELVFDFIMTDLSTVNINSGGGRRNIASNFVSYKTDGQNYYPVPFILEFSEDDGETWSATAPEWLAMNNGINYDGNLPDNPQNLGLSINAQINIAPDPHHDILSASDRQKTDFDLSTYNVATGETILPSTANCYVIDGWGTFRFPVVYGNAIKDGGPNEAGYKRQDYTALGEQYLDYYKDHLNNPIMQPYIALQPGHSSANLSASVLWTDVPGLVTDVAIEGSGSDAYITFSVPQEAVTQGNASIAVFAGNDIAWSWHIWVTEEDFTSSEAKIGNYTFAPVNLGWVGPKSHLYMARRCSVRARQLDDENGKTSQVSVVQNGSTPSTFANSLYYQWGRKDPLQATVGNANTLKTYYYPSGTDFQFQWNVNEKPTLGKMIMYPYIHYSHSTTNNSYQANLSAYYRNNWNSNYASDNSLVMKTIYDPCPVGFVVPGNQARIALLNASRTEVPATDNKPRGYELGDSGQVFLAAGGGWNRNRDQVHTGPYNVGSAGFYWTTVPFSNSVLSNTAYSIQWGFEGTIFNALWNGYANTRPANTGSILPVKE